MEMAVAVAVFMLAWISVAALSVGSQLRTAYLIRQGRCADLSRSEVQALAVADVATFPVAVIRTARRAIKRCLGLEGRAAPERLEPTFERSTAARQHASVVDPTRIEPRIVPPPQAGVPTLEPIGSSNRSTDQVVHEPQAPLRPIHPYADGNAALDQDLYLDDGLVPV